MGSNVAVARRQALVEKHRVIPRGIVPLTTAPMWGRKGRLQMQLSQLLSQASKDAIRAVVWQHGQLHVAVANPAAAMFARCQEAARDQLAQEKAPELKKAKGAKAPLANTQEDILLDARLVLALILEARKSFQASCAAAYDKAAALKEAAQCRFAVAVKAMKTSGCGRCWTRLATIVAKQVNVLTAREEEALARWENAVQG